MKYCPSCKLNKSANEFGNNRSRGDSLNGECKSCANLRARKLRESKPEARAQVVQRYNLSAKAKAARKKYMEKGGTQSKVKNRQYMKRRRDSDINFKISANLRTRLWFAIKREWKYGSAVKDLGCSIGEFKVYLEGKFAPGMTWENWARKGWHIDHILPLASFDLTNRDHFLSAVHYTNLQPLWWQDNLSKRYSK